MHAALTQVTLHAARYLRGGRSFRPRIALGTFLKSFILNVLATDLAIVSLDLPPTSCPFYNSHASHNMIRCSIRSCIIRTRCCICFVERSGDHGGHAVGIRRRSWMWIRDGRGGGQQDVRSSFQVVAFPREDLRTRTCPRSGGFARATEVHLPDDCNFVA